MAIFSPDFSAPHDVVGFGIWRIRHQLEHVQLAAKARALSSSLQVPEYDLGFWDDQPAVVASWLNKHNQVHTILRIPGGVAGIDLSAVNLADDSEWFEWQADHAVEHVALRQFYGIT